MSEKQFVTYDDLDRYCDDVMASLDFRKYISDLQKNGMKLEGVYGPPRGGVLLAQMLADKMGIEVLGAPCEGCIIVDDIADHGRTLKPYMARNTNYGQYNSPEEMTKTKGKVPKHFIMTMFYHPQSETLPQFYTDMKSHDINDPGKWVVFPHEMTNKYWDKDKVKQFETQIKAGGAVNVDWQQVDGFIHKVVQQIEKAGNTCPGIYAAAEDRFMAAAISNVFDSQDMPFKMKFLDKPEEGCIMISSFSDDITRAHGKKYGCKNYSMFGQEGMIQADEQDYDKIVMPHMRGEAKRKELKRQYGVVKRHDGVTEAKDLLNNGLS